MKLRSATLAPSLLCATLFGCRVPAPEQPSAAQALQTAQVAKAAALPKLVLQITVDQLSEEVLEGFLSRLGAAHGGFGRLVQEGAWFTQAYYLHTSTETAVGHATLFTGALPRDHGIVGNEWYDLAQRKEVFAVEDPSSALVGSTGTGRSARSLLVPTVGDALFEATQGKAMVVAVSEKDRAAILPAGHRGRAYWLDDSAGNFITSSYHGALPTWLEAHASEISPEHLRGQAWTLSLDAARYQAVDDRPWEKPYKLFGRVFPHPLLPPLPPPAANAAAPVPVSTKDFVRGVKYTPFGDEAVLAFVRGLFANEPIGQDDVPDLLSVSFSSTDYVGHSYGPESREAEDNFVRLDRTLEALLALAEERAGPGRLFVVLSADHGVTPPPEALVAQGIDAGRIEPKALVQRLNAALGKRFGFTSDVILDFVNPSLWLDESAIAARGLALVDVEHALVELAQAEPHMFAAFSRSDALAGALSGSELGKRIAATTHPQRSGHVYLVAKEHWMLSTGQEDLCATHGSPWPEDSHVPILVWGPGLPRGRMSAPADPRNITPTVAKWLSVPVPSGASAGPLPGF